MKEQLTNHQIFKRLEEFPWIYELSQVGLFYILLKLPFISESVLFGSIVLFFILQVLKILFIRKNIFDGPGIFSFTMLMFYSYLIFLPIGEYPYSSRVLLGWLALFALWLGFFHYSDVVKPINKAISKNKKTEQTDLSFSLNEEETSLFIKRDKVKPTQTINEVESFEDEELDIEDLLDELPK